MFYWRLRICFWVLIRTTYHHTFRFLVGKSKLRNLFMRCTCTMIRFHSVRNELYLKRGSSHPIHESTRRKPRAQWHKKRCRILWVLGRQVNIVILVGTFVHYNILYYYKIDEIKVVPQLNLTPGSISVTTMPVCIVQYRTGTRGQSFVFKRLREQEHSLGTLYRYKSFKVFVFIGFRFVS